MHAGYNLADIMTKSVVVASERWPLAEIAALMQKHKVKCIPIVRTTDGAVIGIVSRANAKRSRATEVARWLQDGGQPSAAQARWHSMIFSLLYQP